MNRSSRKTFVRGFLALGTAAALAVPVASAQAAGVQAHEVNQAGHARGCVVVYFDLGETLVHTADDSGMQYMPGAAAYLRELRERHIAVGLITNVPSSWGTTDAERAAALRKEVDKNWKDTAPFAWADFGDRILTPRTEAERKPAPALWERAKEQSGGCRLVYQAETAQETAAAASLGYVAYQIGRPSWPAYLPARLIELLTHLPR